MTARAPAGGESPDPLGLAAAGVLVSALLGVAWPGFAAVTATLSVLVFVALLLRWADAAPAVRSRGRLALLASAGLSALGAYLLLVGPGRVALLASATLLGALLGRPASRRPEGTP
ncbi:MAG: hypothetical protein L3K13_02420 [Thermoplasmata archaeon]|nr:hypothetical protein [Thermoplasmata archaeon]